MARSRSLSSTRRVLVHALAAVLLGAMGCGEELALRVDIPFEAGMQSMLVALEGPIAAELHAIDATGGPRTLSSFDDLGDASHLDVTAFHYAEPLAELFVEPGLVPVSGGSRPMGRPIPRFDLGFVQRVTPNGLEPRAPVSSLAATEITPAVRSLLLPLACRSFQLEVFALNMSGRVAGSVPLTATSALVVVVEDLDRPPVFFEVDADGPERLPLSMPDFSPRSVTRAPNGDLYMAGVRLSDGEIELRVGTVAAGFRALPPPLMTPAADPDVAHDGSEPGVVYLLDQGGRVERFDGVSWSIFGEPTSGGQHLAWSGPNEVIVDDREGLSLIRVDRAGSQAEFPLPYHASIDGQSNVNFVTALRWTAAMGVVAATHVKGVYRRASADSGWETLLGTRNVTTGAISALADYRGGVLYGGHTASVGQYFRGAEVCSEVMLNYAEVLTTLVALEPGVIVGTAESTSISVAVLRDVSDVP